MAIEVTALRAKTSKTYDMLDGTHKFVGGLAPLHFGAVNDSVNFTPVPTTIPLDGWKVDQADYTYSLGRKSGQDGWFGFGGLQGQNTIFFRLARMGYMHWPTRVFDNISGAPDYDRTNLTNAVTNFDTGEEILPTGLKASWGNIWNTPGGGEVSIDVNANGEKLKLDVILNQAGREWVVVNRPTATPVAQTYFGMVFQLDLSDIPKIVRDGIIQGNDTDFDDVDGLPTELRDGLDNLLAFMPVDYAYAGNKDNEQKLKLTKRFWLDDDGNHYLLVGAKVAEINSLPVGDIRFDPTFGAAQVAVTTRDGQEHGDVTWTENGADSDGNRVGDVSSNQYDMGFSWDNVTIAAGSTISSATIELYMKWHEPSSDIVTRLHGFKVADVAVFSTTNRPSQQAQTTAFNDRTFTDASDFATNTWISLDDATTITQEIIDQGGWASGNALGYVLKDNGSAAGDRWQFQDYGRQTAFAAKITIVYTTGVGGRIMSSLANHGGLAGHGGIAGIGGGLAG